MKDKFVLFIHIGLTLAFFVALLLFAVRIVHASTPSHCKVYEFRVTADSTSYEIDCGSHAKIKSIVETD